MLPDKDYQGLLGPTLGPIVWCILAPLRSYPSLAGAPSGYGKILQRPIERPI